MSAKLARWFPGQSVYLLKGAKYVTVTVLVSASAAYLPGACYADSGNQSALVPYKSAVSLGLALALVIGLGVNARASKQGLTLLLCCSSCVVGLAGLFELRAPWGWVALVFAIAAALVSWLGRPVK